MQCSVLIWHCLYFLLQLNQCGDLPSLIKPTSDIPQPVGPGTLDSAVPTSLFNHMYERIFQDLKASFFDKFDGISQMFVSRHCDSAVDSGVCWARTELVLRTVRTDSVNFGTEAIDENPDIIVTGLDTNIRDLREFFIQDLATLTAQLNSTMSFVANLPETLTQTQPSSMHKIMPVCPMVLVSTVFTIIMWMR